jgi:flagellar hook-length control protein FliK
MSVIELSQLIALPLFDTIMVEPGAANASLGSSGSFNDYLQRAQTSSTGADYAAAGDSSRDAGQPPVPRADELHSTADQPPRPNRSEDNIDNLSGTESAGITNLPKLESKPPADKNKPAGQDTAVTRSNKEKEDNKKDNRDNCDSASAGKSQDNQLNAQMNSGADNAKNHSQSENNTLEISGEIGDASNPLSVASKDAKANKAAGASRTSAADEPDASVSTSGKKKASKKTAFEEETNADKLAVAQTIETAPATGKGRASAAKTAKGASASPHDAQGKTANQNGKSQPSDASAADAAVYQESPGAVATANSAALQVAANPPIMATTSVKDKIDLRAADRISNTASESKAADPVNVLQRLDQPGIKTTASSQGTAEDARSDLNSVRFVQRVERAFAAMSDGGGTVRLRLNPPELGSVHMEISVNKGVMKARLEAETKEAKNLLLENLPALRDRLAQQNIKIQKFDVDLRDPSSGGMSQQTANQAQTGSGEGGYRAPRQQTLENGGAATTTTEAQRLSNHNGQLNVIV